MLNCWSWSNHDWRYDVVSIRYREVASAYEDSGKHEEAKDVSRGDDLNPHLCRQPFSLVSRLS